jgi:hypothetical protein
VHSLSLRAPSSGVPCTRSSNCCMHVHTSEKKRASCRMDVFCLGREKERYTPGKNIVEQEGTSVCMCVVVTRTTSQCVPECGEREHRTGRRAPLCSFQDGKMCESAGRGEAGGFSSIRKQMPRQKPGSTHTDPASCVEFVQCNIFERHAGV